MVFDLVNIEFNTTTLPSSRGALSVDKQLEYNFVDPRAAKSKRTYRRVGPVSDLELSFIAC